MPNFYLFKKSTLILLLYFTALTAKSQTIRYEITKDDPGSICRQWIYVDPLQMDAPFKNSYGLSFNAGIWGMLLTDNKMGIDFSARYGYGTMAGLVESSADPALQAEGALLLILSDKTNLRKNTKVVLRESRKYSYTYNSDVIVRKYIVIPAKRRNMNYARAGAFFKRTPFKAEDNLGVSFKGNIRTAGVFVGLGNLNISNVYIKTGSGERFARSAVFRTYLDLLVAPVRSIYSGTSTPVPAGVKPLTGILGYRFGFFAMPAERRQKGRSGISVGAEIGSRPGEGLYATTSFMFSLSRR